MVGEMKTPTCKTKCLTSESSVKAIQESEHIIKNKKSDIVWLAYCQGQIFQNFKEKKPLVNMVLKLNVSNYATIVFKIALKKLIDDLQKQKIHRCLFIIFKNI